VKVKKRQNKTAWLLTAGMIIFCLLNVAGWFWHEKWLDEAQIWLIARDLNPRQIIQQMHYELSPSLWHQMLHIFAANNWPYITQSILNSLIMIVAVYLLLWQTKIKTSIKLLLIFSYYLAFEYSLISKSYSLTIMFLLIIAVLKRNNKSNWWQAIMIFFLANTNTIGMVSAGALIIMSIWELIGNKEKKIKNWLPLILMSGGLLIAIWQIYPVVDINHSNGFTHYLTPVNGMAMAFFPWKILTLDNLLLMREGIWHFSIWNTLIVILFLVLIIWRFWRQPKLLVFLLINYLGLSYLLIFCDNGHLRHYGFFLIWLIITLILDNQQNRPEQIGRKIFDTALIISLIFLTICGCKEYYMEIRYPFSPTKEAAQFIKQNNLEDTYWITDSFYMTSLLPYFPEKKIWQAGCYREISFFQVDRECIDGLRKTEENIKNIVKKKTLEKQRIIYFTNKPLDDIGAENWKLLYQNKQYVFGYDYPTIFIYQYSQ